MLGKLFRFGTLPTARMYKHRFLSESWAPAVTPMLKQFHPLVAPLRLWDKTVRNEPESLSEIVGIRSRCNFAGSDLLRSSFRDVEFIECQLMGINWAALTRFESCRFQSCKLDYSVFQDLRVRRLKFIDCSLKEADFSDADLSESNFSGSILVGASFAGADISKADLRTAKEYFIDPRSTKIKGAKFCFPEAASLLSALGAEVDF